MKIGNCQVRSELLQLKQVDFRFTDDVDPYLRDFSRDIHYTKYLYRFVRDLQSSHSIRIYELLRRLRILVNVNAHSGAS
ncbi:RepB family plasmid replication initiator protein [Endozoicomonas atrinae]|uniref:RepB family plasmid replication initiator protein n=1 Tax=Endozoicomonas atrinae TaxID=1333660 RepID=UPI003B008A47